MNIFRRVKHWFGGGDILLRRTKKEYKCALCDLMIRVTSSSCGWYSKPSCITIWNPFFYDREQIYICSKHKTSEIEKLCKEKDCSAISNGWNRWDVE